MSVTVIGKRTVTFMLFIQSQLHQLHGLCAISGSRGAFIHQATRTYFRNGIHISGWGQIIFCTSTSTGTTMKRLSSSSSSPDDNSHRIVMSNSLNNDHLRSILQRYDVRSNELDERCLMALNRCPSEMADYSVRAFAQQRQKREIKKEARISDPSSYIMAVLR